MKIRLPQVSLSFLLVAIAFFCALFAVYEYGYQSGLNAPRPGEMYQRSYPVTWVDYDNSTIATNDDYQGLAELLTTTCSPSHWKVNGGEGDLTPHFSNKSIVIHNYQFVHEEVQNLLNQLERLNQTARSSGNSHVK